MHTSERRVVDGGKRERIHPCEFLKGKYQYNAFYGSYTVTLACLMYYEACPES
jgi:hypothetical protein